MTFLMTLFKVMKIYYKSLTFLRVMNNSWKSKL